MKRKWLILIVIFLLIASGTIAFAQSAGFNLPWFTIDGGGNRSQGGAFELSGIIGQPDAGQISGGLFTLEGGFGVGLTVGGLPGVYLPIIFR